MRAVLAVIGGIDARPRLGGLVMHEEWGLCTIARITQKGRITVQVHDLNSTNVCRLPEISPVSSHTISINIFLFFTDLN